MIYDIRDPNRKPQRMHIFDATGRQWKYCTRVDTETGEITFYVTNEAGEFILSASKEDCLQETLFVPSPLRVEPVQETP